MDSGNNIEDQVKGNSQHHNGSDELELRVKHHRGYLENKCLPSYWAKGQDKA